ncbi:MAG: AraC family transcriptional regulator [SAR202 cluster bacterium]|nr:AraC family transcriptional regulator [SAR202 cluster bacterium]MQG78695.1 AraC family transcriptional regulator [SAR202 cluster bacterium]
MSFCIRRTLPGSLRRNSDKFRSQHLDPKSGRPAASEWGPSVEQVARQVGFNSRSHFSTALKDQFGVSPAACSEGQLVGQV